MAKRDMKETAEKAKKIIKEEYDLTAAEIQELVNIAHDKEGGVYDAVCTAFLYGYMMGHRATQGGKSRE